MIFAVTERLHAGAWALLLSIALGACTPQNAAPKPVASDLQAASALTTTPPNTPANTTHIQVVLAWEALHTEVMLAPDTGRLEQVLIQTGQRVQAGQRLVQIKPTATTTQRTHTQSVNQAAKAQAHQKWQQDKKLYAQGFISQAALDKSATAYRLASQTQTTTQTIATSAAQTSPIWLQAPFNGVIEPLTILSGNEVKNGQKLFSIKPLDAKRIKILVSQDNVHELFVGQRLFLQHNEHILNLQISELPAIDDKQYVLAYAIWPKDVPKPTHLEHTKAYLVLQTDTAL